MEAKFRNALKLGLLRANKQKLRILNECEEQRVTLRMCLRQGREQDAAKLASSIISGGYRAEALALVAKHMGALAGVPLSVLKGSGAGGPEGELGCAVQSVVFAAACFPELPELVECRQILVSTIGKGYFSEANMRSVDPSLSAYTRLPPTATDFSVVQRFVCGFAAENRLDISSLTLFSSPQQQQQQQLPQQTPSQQQQPSQHKPEPKKSFFFGLFGPGKKVKSEIDPTKCCVAKGTLKAYGIVGVPSLFTIELRDASGALCTAPDLHGGNSIGNNNSSNNSNSSSDGGSGTKTGTEVRILVSGPEALRIVGTYTDNKDGTLTGAFTPPVPGLYAIAVYIGTTLLGNDAYRQTAKTPEEMRRTDPAQCVVEGPGLLAPMANDLAVLTVTAVDAAGARRPGGADKVSVLISGPDGEHIVGDVDDNGDGTYTASFLPVKKGTYAIAVYVEAKLVGNDGKPFIVNITKDITEVPVSETPKITKVTSGGKPDDNDNNNNSEGNNNSNNSVWASIETETEEESQDPEVTTEPMLCLASGPGLTDGGAAQETQTFTIRAVNSDGKQRRRGGDRFRVFISGPDSLHIRGKVHDLGNGTYTAAYVPPVEGLYNIAVYMGDVPVGEGKPVQVAVVSSFVGDQRGLNKGKTGTAKDGGSGSGDGKHEGDDGNMLNGSSNEYDDSAETELMERFKVLHEPLNSVKDKPGYLEKKKKAAERMKKKK